MKIIGLTGGIGTGKSLVSSLLGELGAYIIDADKIAKAATQKGSAVLDDLMDYFGSEILNTDRELDRKKLAGIAFNSSQKLYKLNEIVHKEVFKQIKQLLSSLNNKGYDGIVVLDVPIPTGEFLELSEQVWVVDAEYETRISRIIERNGMSRHDAKVRIDAQMTRDEYLNLADTVIPNNGTKEELKSLIYKQYREL